MAPTRSPRATSPSRNDNAGRRADCRTRRMAARPGSWLERLASSFVIPISRPCVPTNCSCRRLPALCCPPSGYFISTRRAPSTRRVITHAHADHARAGHGAVLATRETLDLMRLRYGDDFAGPHRPIGYGASRRRSGGVTVTFHPAGHVLGSAQIAVECGGLRIVASGDYKDVADPTCAPFEPVAVRRVHHRGDLRSAGVPARRSGRARSPSCLRSVALFPERAHLVGAYSLGKAQRVIALCARQDMAAPIYLHGALERITRYYAQPGFDLGELRQCATRARRELAGAITLVPAVGAERSCGRAAFPIRSRAFASGWMRVRARARQRGVELPLVISDHADWDGLTRPSPRPAPRKSG